MDTLVIGYGKIGCIKSSIWKSLGRNVYVQETDPRKVEAAVQDGFRTYAPASQLSNQLIVDISTPAAQHLASLIWVIENVTPHPKTILLEKPLVSSQAELRALTSYLEKNTTTIKNIQLVVNESYYLSSATLFVIDDMRRRAANASALRMELSKNRLPDVIAGRFIDENLGSLGIELPHMLALSQSFGLELNKLVVDSVSVLKRCGEFQNEGFKIHACQDGLAVHMESYLGDFKIDSAGKAIPNDTIVRTLQVETDKCKYVIEFDPVPGLDRFAARIRIYDMGETLINETVVGDDHLTSHLLKLHESKAHKQLDQLLSIDNSLEIAKYLFDLKAKARYVNLDHSLRSRAVK